MVYPLTDHGKYDRVCVYIHVRLCTTDDCKNLRQAADTVLSGWRTRAMCFSTPFFSVDFNFLFFLDIKYPCA